MYDWSRPGDGNLQAISRWVSIPLNSHVMKVGHILFINPLNTFYLRLYDVGHMVLLAREETCCRHYMSYSYRLGGGGRAELLTCPCPLKVQACPPRDEKQALGPRVSGRKKEDEWGNLEF